MRDKIKLVSSAGTGYFYTTTKNKRTMPNKMEIKKFDPVVRQHVVFKEAKIKQDASDTPVTWSAFFVFGCASSHATVLVVLVATVARMLAVFAFKEVIVFTLIIPVLLWRSLTSHHVEEEEE